MKAFSAAGKLPTQYLGHPVETQVGHQPPQHLVDADEVPGSGPDEHVVVETGTGLDAIDDAAVQQTGWKLGDLPVAWPSLPALPPVPSLKDALAKAPKGVVGVVGGILVGGGAMGGALAADDNMDVGSKVVISVVTAACMGVGGYLLEQACRIDN